MHYTISKAQIEQVIACLHCDAEETKLDEVEVMMQGLLAQPEGEPVATVTSWTNGSYWRNYKLEWHKDVPEGTKLFTHPAPFNQITVDDVSHDMEIEFTKQFTNGAGMTNDEMIAAAVNAFMPSYMGAKK